MPEPEVNWDQYLEVASISDVGMRRASNQDNLCVSMATSLTRWREQGHLFLVADGMGGHQAGDVASQLAVSTVVDYFEKTIDDLELTWPFKLNHDQRGQENRLECSIKMANGYSN